MQGQSVIRVALKTPLQIRLRICIQNDTSASTRRLYWFPETKFAKKFCGGTIVIVCVSMTSPCSFNLSTIFL